MMHKHSGYIDGIRGFEIDLTIHGRTFAENEFGSIAEIYTRKKKIAELNKNVCYRTELKSIHRGELRTKLKKN